MAINIALKLAIVKSGRSQSAIAQSTGIDETILSRIVNGWREPTEAQKLAIAEAVLARPEQLFRKAS